MFFLGKISFHCLLQHSAMSLKDVRKFKWHLLENILLQVTVRISLAEEGPSQKDTRSDRRSD